MSRIVDASRELRRIVEESDSRRRFEMMVAFVQNHLIKVSASSILTGAVGSLAYPMKMKEHDMYYRHRRLGEIIVGNPDLVEEQSHPVPDGTEYISEVWVLK